jgi:hypothetical protein
VDIEGMMKVKWYAKINDLIGGWCVMTMDATPAEADEITGGTVMCEVGCFMDERIAVHVADMHNRWLFGQQFLSEGRVQKLEQLRELSSELIAEFGEPTEEELAEARKIWPPSPEFTAAEGSAEEVGHHRRLAASYISYLGSFRVGELSFETMIDGKHYKKVTHLPTGKTGYGNSDVDAMMNLAETWDEQRS